MANGAKSRGVSSFKSTIKDQTGKAETRIGTILSREGRITSIQLNEALAIQARTRERLSSILLHLGHIDPDTVVNVLGRRYNYNSIRFADIKPDPEILERIPFVEARKYMAFPLGIRGEELLITMAEPTDTRAVEFFQRKIRKSVRTFVSTENDIIHCFRDHYKISDSEYKRLLHFEEDMEEQVPITAVEDFGSLASEAAEVVSVGSLDSEGDRDEFMASDAPIIKLVNAILTKAIGDGVSDIHIEPFEKSFQIRYRLDGALHKALNLPVSIKNAVISRIKILAEMDIAERRRPQDGRVKLRLGRKKTVDFRVSTLPTLFGESVVMRVLDSSALNIDLTRLGFEHDVFDRLRRCISRPYGLILVTGPTGSGKTTTLYSILNRLNREETKILTVEDPVEFNFRGINQVPVKEEVGMGFAKALKAFLRQDPDIIMVGEIRDLETAEIAIKAAMTGHLVFATLHTNDCASTICRLKDIGIPSYMLSASVSMVLSQRLVRRLCPQCKQRVVGHHAEELESHGFDKSWIPDLEIYGPQGCSHCNHTGYRGRIGVYELMEVNEDVAKAIGAEVEEEQLRRVAVNEGMLPLREAGLQKVRTRETSLDEVLKKTILTKESLPPYLVNPDIETYEDRDVIVWDGNTDIDFFQLVSGALNVIKEGRKIAEIRQPGEYFGEMAAITGEPRSATVVSQGRSRVKRYPGDKLDEVIEKYPEVARHLFTAMATRLRETDQRLVSLIGKRKKQA